MEIHKITEGVERQMITRCSSQYDTPIELSSGIFKTDRRKYFTLLIIKL